MKNTYILIGLFCALAISLFVALTASEPQELCFVNSHGSGGALVLKKNEKPIQEINGSLVPKAFEVPTGSYNFYVKNTYARAEAVIYSHGKVVVYDSHSPRVISTFSDLYTNDSTMDIDFCNFISDKDIYPVEENGIVYLYDKRDGLPKKTGFEIARVSPESKGDMLVLVSPKLDKVLYNRPNPDARYEQKLYISHIDATEEQEVAQQVSTGLLLLDTVQWNSNSKIVYKEFVNSPSAAGLSTEVFSQGIAILWEIDIETGDKKIITSDTPF